MRRPFALAAVAVVFLIAFAIWRMRAPPTTPATCSWDTLERVDFPDGHIASRRRRSPTTMKIGIHLHGDDKLTPCHAGEGDEDCKVRAAKAFGPLPTPAENLQIAVEGTSQRVARATPSYWRTQASNPHEQQTWVPDHPGARPASGNVFKANFDGAWVAGVIAGPMTNGSYLLDVWCSVQDAPMPGTKATGTNGE